MSKIFDGKPLIMRLALITFFVFWDVVIMLGRADLRSQEIDPSSTGRLSVSEVGHKIALASRDNKVRVWNLDSKKLLHVIEVGEPALSVALSHDGNELLAGTVGDRSDPNERRRSSITCWDIQGETPILKWETPVIGGCQGLAFSKSSDWVAGICIYSRLVFLDRKTGKLRRVWTEDGNGFWQLAISFDEKFLVTAGQSTRVWDLSKNMLPKEDLSIDHWPKEGESARVQLFEPWSGASSVSASRTSNTAYLIGFFRGISGRAWDCARIDFSQGRKLDLIKTELGASDGVFPSCLALSPDSLSLAIGFEQGVLEIRNTDGGLLRRQQLERCGNIRCVAFVDRDRIAIATEYGSALLLVEQKELNEVQRLFP